jgi:hypothetical protein
MAETVMGALLFAKKLRGFKLIQTRSTLHRAWLCARMRRIVSAEGFLVHSAETTPIDGVVLVSIGAALIELQAGASG